MHIFVIYTSICLWDIWVNQELYVNQLKLKIKFYSKKNGTRISLTYGVKAQVYVPICVENKNYNSLLK